MNLKIHPQKIKGYLLIYLMLLCNQTGAFLQYLDKWTLYLAVLFSLILLVKIRKRIATYSLTFIFGLLISVMFVRYSVGGVGVDFWADRALMIAVTACAILFNGSDFLDRFIKTVVFLATVSLALWCVQITIPEIWKNFPGVIVFDTDMGTRIYSTATDYRFVANKGYGLFLYTMHNGYRNTSIFTEPGVYQMVLSTAIFCLLFFTDYLPISKKKMVRYLLILVAALVTTMSTTGYISLTLIALGVLLSRKQERNMQRRLQYLIVTLVIIILGDYMIRGQESFLYIGVIGKLFTQSGTFSLEASSGAYRYGSLIVYLLIMIAHPLGAGVNTVSQVVDFENTAYCGFSLLRDGAILGIIPMLGAVLWLIYPFVKKKTNIVTVGVYAFVYINTMAAQSSAFYPALIVIPMFLMSGIEPLFEYYGGGDAFNEISSN